MTTLRVLLTAPPSTGTPLPWGLYDAAGMLVRSGHDTPDGWPGSERIEAVIAAPQARIACVTLPPLAPGRIEGAAAFAVEDQLAGPRDAHHLAASAQGADGKVRVVIASRDLVAACRERGMGGRKITRVIVEPELALPDTGWRWCAVDAKGAEGFLRLPDGSAFAVGAVASDGALPAELNLALARAKRDGASPRSVRADAPIADSLLMRWKTEYEVVFDRGVPWRWLDSTPAAFAGATDLLRGEFGAPAAPPGDRIRLFAPALWLAAAAIAFNTAATAGEWGWQKYSAWQRGREWVAVAASAGIAPENAATAAAADGSLARMLADQRHSHGKVAPDDALPLLARIAPVLMSLPPGSVRSATYSDRHWTLDLGRADAAQVGAIDARMRDAGLSALVATSAAGTKVRVGQR